ncbi:hypothetical protein SDC9_176006 [bioreactor metagenome]|uniref:Uncharacterized protein n=1 Tax=bioreactor metagenome TaxID=1076179 RepID=A0A645GX10_9ZZZZ
MYQPGRGEHQPDQRPEQQVGRCSGHIQAAARDDPVAQPHGRPDDEPSSRLCVKLCVVDRFEDRDL